MNANLLDLTTSPQEFFHSKITEASSHLKIKLDQHVEFYLVNLLTKFVMPGGEKSQSYDEVLNTPLAFMLKKAVEAPLEHQPHLFRHIGDSSLYVSGFFQDYFNGKCFDISYYVTMGASAYHQASTLVKVQTRDDGLHETLGSLAENFQRIVDIVAQASDSSAMNQDTNLLNLYDRWNRSGSDRLRALLEDKGIHPIKVPLKLAQ